MAREKEEDPENVSQVLANERRKSSYGRILRNLIALAVVVSVAYLGVESLNTGDAAFSYTTLDATRGDLTVLVTATGSLKPLNQVDVGTEVSGTIESIEVDFNDRVKKNQVLAVLDRTQLDAQFRQSQAALALSQATVLEAQATVTETQKRLTRVKDLIAKKLSAQEELDATVAAFTRAEAGLAVAKAQVDQARAQVDAEARVLEKAVIRSPIDGIVLERRVEPGQTVAATLQTPVLFTLAESLTQMVLHVDVDEADVGQVVVGLPAVFTVDAYPDRTFPATIEKVRFAPKNADGVVTYETLLAVDNTTLLLRPGMTATAEIRVRHIKDAVLVPNAALRFSPLPLSADGTGRGGGGFFGRLLPQHHKEVQPATETEESTERRVWVLRAGRPTPVAVKTGATDGVRVQILEGDIEPGTPLLVDMRRADD